MLTSRLRAPMEALHKRDLCMDCRIKSGNDERERTKEINSEAKPTDANVIMPCVRARPRLKREAHDCRRSTAALAKGTFVVFGATPGQVSWDAAKHVLRVPLSGRYPCLSLSPARTAHPSPSARGMMPKAARERVASPPAGTALARVPRLCLPGHVRDGRGSTYM